MPRHIEFELRCSALLPLSNMAAAFEAAMDLVGEYEPAKDEIAQQWQGAAQDLSQHFERIKPAPPCAAGQGDPTRVQCSREPDAALTVPVRWGDVLQRAGMKMPSDSPLGLEWSRRVHECLSDPRMQHLQRLAIEATQAYRVALLAFVGGAPAHYVQEFLRRAVEESIHKP